MALSCFIMSWYTLPDLMRKRMCYVICKRGNEGWPLLHLLPIIFWEVACSKHSMLHVSIFSLLLCGARAFHGTYMEQFSFLTEGGGGFGHSWTFHKLCSNGKQTSLVALRVVHVTLFCIDRLIHPGCLVKMLVWIYCSGSWDGPVQCSRNYHMEIYRAVLPPGQSLLACGHFYNSRVMRSHVRESQGMIWLGNDNFWKHVESRY